MRVSRRLTWPRVLLASLFFGAVFYSYVLFIAPKKYVSSAHLQFVSSGTSAIQNKANVPAPPPKIIDIREAVALVAKSDAVTSRLQNGGFLSYPHAKTPDELQNSLAKGQLYWRLAKDVIPQAFELAVVCADPVESELLVNAIIDGFRDICKIDGQLEVCVVKKPNRGEIYRWVGLPGY